MKVVKALSLTVIALCLGLTACNNRDALKQTQERMSFQVNMHLVAEDKITETCTALNVPYKANGCAILRIRGDSQVCDVYVMPQRYSADEQRLAIIGHEIWHCMYGQWHD